MLRGWDTFNKYISSISLPFPPSLSFTFYLYLYLTLSFHLSPSVEYSNLSRAPEPAASFFVLPAPNIRTTSNLLCTSNPLSLPPAALRHSLSLPLAALRQGLDETKGVRTVEYSNS